MATGKDVLALAVKDIGYRREADGSNKFGRWYGMDKVPYCMQAVQYWYAMAGIPLPFKTASCGALLNWYRENDPECVGRDPVPGSIVIFDFPDAPSGTDHTGLFEGVCDDEIQTVDGNTSNLSQHNGGWVMRRSRKLDYARPTYITPRAIWPGARKEKAAEKEKKEAGERMTKEQFDTLMDNYLASRAKLPPSPWSGPAREWAEANGIVQGDQFHDMRYASFPTREELVTMLYRLAGEGK